MGHENVINVTVMLENSALFLKVSKRWQIGSFMHRQVRNAPLLSHIPAVPHPQTLLKRICEDVLHGPPTKPNCTFS